MVSAVFWLRDDIMAQKASTWKGKLSASCYETDDYIHRHVHLPRECKLGEQWEHYGWHGPEPHILLFRRPKHTNLPAQPAVCPRPPQEACPRSPDNTNTLQDRIQQLEAELQHSQDKLRESMAQEHVHQHRLAQLHT